MVRDLGDSELAAVLLEIGLRQKVRNRMVEIFLDLLHSSDL